MHALCFRRVSKDLIDLPRFPSLLVRWEVIGSSAAFDICRDGADLVLRRPPAIHGGEAKGASKVEALSVPLRKVRSNRVVFRVLRSSESNRVSDGLKCQPVFASGSARFGQAQARTQILTDDRASRPLLRVSHLFVPFVC